MPSAGCAAAYLVMTYVITSSGEFIEEGGTVCFDLGLAMEMAEADCANAAGACVFMLTQRGEVTDRKLLAGFGLFQAAGPTVAGEAAHAGKALLSQAIRRS